MFCACRLAKEGYFGGNPMNVLKAPVNVVMAALNYESFYSDYTAAVDEMNKES